MVQDLIQRQFPFFLLISKRNSIRFALGLFHKALKFLLHREMAEITSHVISGNRLIFSLNETRLKRLLVLFLYLVIISLDS